MIFFCFNSCQNVIFLNNYYKIFKLFNKKQHIVKNCQNMISTGDSAITIFAYKTKKMSIKNLLNLNSCINCTTNFVPLFNNKNMLQYWSHNKLIDSTTNFFFLLGFYNKFAKQIL